MEHSFNAGTFAGRLRRVPGPIQSSVSASIAPCLANSRRRRPGGAGNSHGIGSPDKGRGLRQGPATLQWTKSWGMGTGNTATVDPRAKSSNRWPMSCAGRARQNLLLTLVAVEEAAGPHSAMAGQNLGQHGILQGRGVPRPGYFPPTFSPPCLPWRGYRLRGPLLQFSNGQLIRPRANYTGPRWAGRTSTAAGLVSPDPAAPTGCRVALVCDGQPLPLQLAPERPPQAFTLIGPTHPLPADGNGHSVGGLRWRPVKRGER